MAALIRAVSIIATVGEVARAVGLGARQLAPSPAFMASPAKRHDDLTLEPCHGHERIAWVRPASSFKNLRSAPATERSHHDPVFFERTLAA
jgi:hypothetical protein